MLGTEPFGNAVDSAGVLRSETTDDKIMVDGVRRHVDAKGAGLGDVLGANVDPKAGLASVRLGRRSALPERVTGHTHDGILAGLKALIEEEVFDGVGGI